MCLILGGTEQRSAMGRNCPPLAQIKRATQTAAHYSQHPTFVQDLLAVERRDQIVNEIQREVE
jgi:hypothetical protein